MGGVWVFQIDDLRSDQSLKNAASQRVVPVHKHLLELGFIEFLGDVKKFGFLRVFPNLPYSALNGYGDAVGDWFNGRYMRPAPGSKAPRAAIVDAKKTFHSFRYVVINRLYGLTEKKTLVAEVTGHERGNDVLTNTYITATEAKERAETLNLIDFPFLQHTPYVSGQFDGFFRRLQRKQTIR